MEPVAYMYELATFKDERGWGGWQKRISFAEPNCPPAAIRNFKPLYEAQHIICEFCRKLTS